VAGRVFVQRYVHTHWHSMIDRFVTQGALLCCAVLCCAVLCCAVLCCAVLYSQLRTLATQAAKVF
jgi:hypothetical protein